MSEEKERTKEELEQELEWVKYRIRMLDIMESKLLKMRAIAEEAMKSNLSKEEIAMLNENIRWLEEQVRGINEESSR